MATGTCCGVPPFLVRKKFFEFEGKELLETNKNFDGPKNLKEVKSLTVRNSCGVASNFVTMTELRKKIMTFRDLLDLPPCISSVSTNELVIGTVKDLHKLYPDIMPCISMSETEGTPMHQALNAFSDAMKSIGDLWMKNDEWMVKCKNNDLDFEQFEKVLAMLDDIIKVASERLFDMMEEDEEMKDYSPQANAFGKAFLESYSDNKISFSCSPVTPTSVLPEMTSRSTKVGTKISYSPPSLLPLRVQALGKLNPIDIKRLSFHMVPHVAVQDSDNQISKTFEEPKTEIEAKNETEMTAADTMDVDKDCNMTEDIRKILMTNLEKVTSDKGKKLIGNPNIQTMPNPDSLARAAVEVVLPPPSLPRLRSNVAAEAAPAPTMLSSNAVVSPIPPPPPLPTSLPELLFNSVAGKIAMLSPHPVISGNMEIPQPPPPPMTSGNMAPLPLPLPSKTLGSIATPLPPPPLPMTTGNVAPPPPPMMLSKDLVPSPPPPMPLTKGAAPPPPPALGGAKSLRPKKAATKLKRSSQMGNLYRLLKGKVEGSSLDGKSSQGRKGKIGAASGGKQGMADALAEMTKRSAYFQQIEEDVKNHAKSIKEVKVALSSFQTKDMAELFKFHKYVESHLEKLTDETQVLARFEDFPTKKLEALRMAAALYSKLDSIVTTLQNWKIVSPLNQLLDKVESYFTKIKGELDTLERTKDEESKKFQSHKIEFHFGILIRIKELLVDVSSSCMELALKERREAKAKENEGGGSKTEGKKKGSGKLLWKAFQFAFRVYTFAGGHDDRADKLTRELAQEIETDPHH